MFTKLIKSAVAAECFNQFTNWSTLCSNAEEALRDPSHPNHAEAVYIDRQVKDATEYQVVNNTLLWIATHSVGGRQWAADDTDVISVYDWGIEEGEFIAFYPEEIQYVVFTSAFSGSGLKYTRVGFFADEGAYGNLEFIPPRDDPEYRGQYWEAWNNAPSL